MRLGPGHFMRIFVLFKQDFTLKTLDFSGIQIWILEQNSSTLTRRLFHYLSIYRSMILLIYDFKYLLYLSAIPYLNGPFSAFFQIFHRFKTVITNQCYLPILDSNHRSLVVRALEYFLYITCFLILFPLPMDLATSSWCCS